MHRSIHVDFIFIVSNFSNKPKKNHTNNQNNQQQCTRQKYYASVHNFFHMININIMLTFDFDAVLRNSNINCERSAETSASSTSLGRKGKSKRHFIFQQTLRL